MFSLVSFIPSVLSPIASALVLRPAKTRRLASGVGSLFLFFVVVFFFVEKVPLPDLGMTESSLTVEERPALLSPETASTMKWEIGYWYWRGRDGFGRDSVEGEPPVDIIYAQVGEHHQGGTQHERIRLSWPERLPKASAYMAVFRCEGPTCTGKQLLSDLVGAYGSLKNQAATKNQNLVGLQIDYDCPTKDLALYGRFLRGLRQALPGEDLLSVTALLDWFGHQALGSDVIPWVDEFVPQFYDVDPTGAGAADRGIAEPVDSARWKGVLNRYGKPYRIGIASFGRLLTVRPSEKRGPVRKTDKVLVWMEGPLEMVSHSKGAFAPYGVSPSGEIIARYKSGRDSSGAKSSLIRLVIPSRKSILSAYQAAREMGRLCRGVVFFRYPLGEEPLVLSPSELSRVIGGGELAQEASLVESHDGLCTAASCNDVLIRPKDRFSSRDRIVTIESSKDLDYFIPADLVQSRLLGSRHIEVRIPAYVALAKIPVGRTVSREPATFTVKEKE